MMKKAFKFLVLMLGGLSYSPLITSALSGESGCVGCHTDGAQLKALFVPPKAAPAEGEG